jgi:hypothetical protein
MTAPATTDPFVVQITDDGRTRYLVDGPHYLIGVATITRSIGGGHVVSLFSVDDANDSAYTSFDLDEFGKAAKLAALHARTCGQLTAARKAVAE